MFTLYTQHVYLDEGCKISFLFLCVLVWYISFLVLANQFFNMLATILLAICMEILLTHVEPTWATWGQKNLLKLPTAS